MRDPYQAFLESPSGTRFRKLRQAILSDPAYDEQMAGAVELERLWRQRDYAAFARREWELRRTWKLSPRFHWLVGSVALETEDLETVELAKFQFQTCLSALLASGQGTIARPYLMTRPADVHDILCALGCQALRQQLVDCQGILLDLVECDGNRELWFDSGVAARIAQPLPSLG